MAGWDFPPQWSELVELAAQLKLERDPGSFPLSFNRYGGPAHPHPVAEPETLKYGWVIGHNGRGVCVFCRRELVHEGDEARARAHILDCATRYMESLCR